MASNQKIIYVYESFKSTTPNFLGTLFVENVRGRESYSFEYDADWLKSSANYMYLDPDLQLYAGRQYPTIAELKGCYLKAFYGEKKYAEKYGDIWEVPVTLPTDTHAAYPMGLCADLGVEKTGGFN